MAGIKASGNSKIDAKGAISSNNKGDGFVAEDGSEIDAPESVSTGNEGAGYRATGGSRINTTPNKQIENPWYQRPVGIVSILVVAGLIVAGISYVVGWR